MNHLIWTWGQTDGRNDGLTSHVLSRLSAGNNLNQSLLQRRGDGLRQQPPSKIVPTTGDSFVAKDEQYWWWPVQCQHWRPEQTAVTIAIRGNIYSVTEISTLYWHNMEKMGWRYERMRPTLSPSVLDCFSWIFFPFITILSLLFSSSLPSPFFYPLSVLDS